VAPGRQHHAARRETAVGTTFGRLLAWPLTLMFADLQSGVSEFKNAREAMESPLAKRLFGIDGVASVFFGSDFVTVSTGSE
jgi:Scaffold protein Nfu/NifU N terminal